jgi:hypothetical protein
MVWLFERDDRAIRVETRFDRDTSEYVLIQQRADDGEIIERFGDESMFRARLETLERQLETESWRRTGPFLLSDGWKL